MQELVHRWRQLPPAERAFVAAGWTLAPGVVLSLRLLGLRNTLRWIEIGSRWRIGLAEDLPTERAAALMRAVFRHHVVEPGCLPQSIIQFLLQRSSGSLVSLRVGVRKAAGAFDAHAWVDDAGRAASSEYDVLLEVPAP